MTDRGKSYLPAPPRAQEDWSPRLIELSDRYRSGYGDISEMVALLEDRLQRLGVAESSPEPPKEPT